MVLIVAVAKTAYQTKVAHFERERAYLLMSGDLSFATLLTQLEGKGTCLSLHFAFNLHLSLPD